MYRRTRQYSKCAYNILQTVYTRVVYATTHAHTIFKFKIAALYSCSRATVKRHWRLWSAARALWRKQKVSTVKLYYRFVVINTYIVVHAFTITIKYLFVSLYDGNIEGVVSEVIETSTDDDDDDDNNNKVVGRCRKTFSSIIIVVGSHYSLPGGWHWHTESLRDR